MRRIELPTFSMSRKHSANELHLHKDLLHEKKTKKTKKLDVFAMMVKHMNEKTPVKQNSGRGIVPDSTISRIQDIYNGEKKEDV